MKYPLAYIDYLYYFHIDRDYFECHEVLESHWKNNGKERTSIWVGLIQIAVSYYHYRRGNKIGAIKMLNKSHLLLSYKEKEIEELGLNYNELMRKLERSLLDLQENLPYRAITLPINNPILMQKCLDYSNNSAIHWFDEIDEAPYEIIHKHKLHRTKNYVYASR